MNTKINSFLSDFKTQLNLSEQEQTALAGFFQFLINRKSPQNISAHYGLLVQYQDKHTLQTFLELLEQSLHELSSTYRLLNASEKNFSKASLSAQKLGENDIFVLTDCSETNNMMHIISEFEKTPQLIKIVCATPAVVEQRFRKNAHFFYRLLPRHIYLGESHSKEITAQFLNLLSSKGYITTKEFDDEIAYYIESIYEATDFQNQKFLPNLLRRIELQMQETNGLSAYKEGQPIDSSFVPYSKRTSSMRKEKEKKQTDKPEYKITELKSPLSDPPISSPTTQTNSSSQTTNVLLLSLSTFSRSIRTSKFDYRWRGCEGTVIGRYQLDPVVKMLARVLATKNQTLDKIVMLCTDDTQNEVKLKTAETEEIISISPLEYFKKQICAYMNPNLKDEERFVPISINLDSPFEGIQNVIQTLRTIQNSERGLTLYLDTHGGLRGVQRVLEATVSLLKIENINIEEAFAVQFSDSNDEPQKNNLITLETENMKIFNFVSGINEFIACGRADILMDYVNSQEKTTHDNSFVNAILDVTNGIQWCCVPAFETGLKTLQTYFEEEKPASTDTSKHETSYLEIYKNDIKQDYKNLLSTTSTVVDEINWCLQKGFYQQALTLIEARISFLLVEQWHVFKVNGKYGVIKKNDTIYYDINDGKGNVTLNDLFNAYVYKIIKPAHSRRFTADILFIRPVDFSELFSSYTGENDNYLSIKDFYKKMYCLNEISESKDFKSVLSTAGASACLSKSRKVKEGITLSTELTIDEELLLAILILHKALKEVRNDMNHASAGFTHNLDSISVVLRHYIKWIEELGRFINPKEK